MLNPIFILGCGRSGTTILGKTLSAHSQIAYLNEPRNLWAAAYPRTDIWTERASGRNGKLTFNSDDVVEEHSIILRASFSKALSDSGRSILIEKLPANMFRTTFVREIFPGARYLYIWRNGCDVAESIEKLCMKGGWFAANDLKWNLLADHARLKPETAELPDMCDTFYLKGLLEWRLSVSAAVEFLLTLPRNQYVSLSHPELTQRPSESVGRVLDFLGLDPDSGISDFVRSEIRSSTGTFSRELTELERRIGGPQLEASLAPCAVGALPDARQFVASRRP